MSTDDTHATLWKLIKDVRFAMVTHRHVDGTLHAHPLTTANKDFDENKTLYFLIKSDSDIAHCISSGDAQVNASYADPDADTYVSVAGVASLNDSVALKDALWSPAAKAWFPGGPQDAHLVVLAVRIDFAEYWDVKESKFVQL